MAKLVVFYSRADENYLGGEYRFVEVGNTEKVAHMIGNATGAELFKPSRKKPTLPTISVASIRPWPTNGQMLVRSW